MWGADLLNQGQDRVLGELGAGYDKSSSYLGQAGGLYNELTDQGRSGLNRYNSLTQGSGEDIQRALEGTGGYQFNLGQGLQALQRTRAAQGMLNSGNTDTDTMSFASGLASNTLGQERQALMPYLGMYQQGIAGQAGNYGQQAGLTTDYYTGRANTLDDTTKNIVGLGTDAFKAGDAAKSANQQMALGALGSVAGLAGKALGGGFGAGGMFTSMFGGK
jgi:hypothetical protein